MTVYMHEVLGESNPADPLSHLCGNFDGNRDLAYEVASRRLGDLWAFPQRCTVFCFFWTPGVPMGPFLLPQSWQSRLCSVWNQEGAFHDVFLQYCIEEEACAPIMG